MTTAQDIINLALTDSGVLGQGQTAQAQDLSDALTRLNWMLSLWNRRRWLVYELVDTSCAMTGATSYTLGNAQSLNIPRIDKLDSAYVVKAGVQTALRMIHSREEFVRIQQAALGTAPEYVFYDSGYPNGNVYIWPQGDNTYTLHVLTKQVLQQFATLGDTFTMPPEYLGAIYTNLVSLFRSAYRLPPDEAIENRAKEALEVLQDANKQDSMLRMPKVMGASVGDLINLALEDSGVFGPQRQPNLQDTEDALWRLNMTLAQWNRRRWLVYHLVETVITCTGANSYAIGLGSPGNVARPDRIEAAFIRQIVATNPTPIDWPLVEIKSWEEWSQVNLKTLAASPSQYFFYDSGWPTGTLYAYPVPSISYEIHILTKAVLQSFVTIQDVVNLPPEYQEALYRDLAVNTRIAYGAPPDEAMTGKAKAALATIRKANFQIGRLSMPRGIRSGPAYNIFSDQGA